MKKIKRKRRPFCKKNDEYLFGKMFRNHIADTIKSKKQTKEIFIEYKKPHKNVREKGFFSQKSD